MTDTLARGSHSTRPYSVVNECLRIQASARRQGLLARLFGRSPILPDARSSFLGARGEINAARALANAGERWHVLHPLEPDAPTLLIGTPGVFTVATKNHTRQRVWVGDDQLLVNGRRTHHLRDARHDARTVARMLGVAVTPVLAIVEPAHLTIKHRAAGVEVLVSSQLPTYLARRPVRLTDDAVAELLANPGLHHSWSADIVDEALRYEVPFARLVAEVDAAWKRRVAWLASGSGVIVSGIIAAMLLT